MTLYCGLDFSDLIEESSAVFERFYGFYGRYLVDEGLKFVLHSGNNGFVGIVLAGELIDFLTDLLVFGFEFFEVGFEGGVLGGVGEGEGKNTSFVFSLRIL